MMLGQCLYRAPHLVCEAGPEGKVTSPGHGSCLIYSAGWWHMQEFMSKWGRPHGASEPDEEEASQASGHSPQPYLSMPATLPELKEREGGAFQESSPPQGYGGEPEHLRLR